MYFTGITIAIMTFITSVYGILSSSRRNITGAPVLGLSTCLLESFAAFLHYSLPTFIYRRFSVSLEPLPYGALANSSHRRSV